MRQWRCGMVVAVLLLGGWLVAFRPGHSGQNAAPTREVADRRMRVGVDASRQEALELRAAGVDHAEGSVAGGREVGGGLDEALEEHVERQLRRDRDARLEEGA